MSGMGSQTYSSTTKARSSCSAPQEIQSSHHRLFVSKGLPSITGPQHAKRAISLSLHQASSPCKSMHAASERTDLSGPCLQDSRRRDPPFGRCRGSLRSVQSVNRFGFWPCYSLEAMHCRCESKVKRMIAPNDKFFLTRHPTDAIARA
jgi:hypothetical protein